MKLDEVTSELLAKAVRIYLDHAYPEDEPGEAVGERADIPAGRRGAELLGDDRFERVPPEADVAGAERFNLRLGNVGYPHMKLGIDRVGKTDEFVLVVDTHDKQLAAVVQAGEQAQFRELLERNRRLQEAIERAWTEAGLPTFTSYLRGRLSGMRSGGNGSRPTQ